MTDGRLAGVSAETLYAGTPAARLAGEAVEALYAGTPAARLAGVSVEVLRGSALTMFDADVAITIELGFGSGPLATTPTWTDVSAYSRGFDTRRGRSSIDDTFPSGTAVVLLDNRDGRFDPNNTSSPYTGNVKIGVPVRVTATYSTTGYVLFYGHVEGWPLAYPEHGKDAVVELPCVENWGAAAGYNLVGDTYSAETSDTRIGNVLDSVGWPATHRTLDTGTATVAAIPEGVDETAADHIARVEQAEQGSVFVARTGYLTFYNRTQFSGAPASTATFGSGLKEYDDVSVAYDNDLLFNRAFVTASDLSIQSASDATSITNHGPQTYTVDNDLLSPTEALGVAEWVVGRHKDVAVRVTGMSVLPQSDPAGLWATVLSLDLRQAITVNVDPPGSGTTLSQLVTVESVAHTVRPKSWRTVITCHPLSTLETTSFWILGTSVLDTGTVLG